MNAAGIVRDAERQGIILSVQDGRLHFSSPKGSLTPEFRETLSERKAEIIHQLLHPEYPLENLQAMADLVGRQAEWLLAHPERFDDLEWSCRREKLSTNIDRLTQALRESGRRLEEFGWACSPVGEWHRAGEAPPEREEDPRRSLLLETLEQVAVLISQAPEMDLCGPEWDAAEAALGNAYPAGLTALQAACDAYLEFVVSRFDAVERPAPEPAAKPVFELVLLPGDTERKMRAYRHRERARIRYAFQPLAEGDEEIEVEIKAGCGVGKPNGLGWSLEQALTQGFAWVVQQPLPARTGRAE